MAVTRKKKGARASTKSTNVGSMRSFRMYPGEKPFFTIRISQQTFYWLIISLLVLALGVWTVFLSLRVQSIYDRVEITNSENQIN